VLLKRLFESPGILQKDLANTTYKDPASVTRTLDLMENKGLVKRKMSPEDRRGFEIYLTSSGEGMVKGILPLAVKMRKDGLKGISDDELKVFKKVLNKLYDNFD
jgi:DNA-binding MarR family transcriptional regulator